MFSSKAVFSDIMRTIFLREDNTIYRNYNFMNVFAHEVVTPYHFPFFTANIMAAHQAGLKTQRSHGNITYMLSKYIEKKTNTVQEESSTFASLSLDQGFQLVIPPRSPASVPEPLERHLTVFCIDLIVVHYFNCKEIKIRSINNSMDP